MPGAERALGSVWMILGVSEAITVESLRLLATTIAALASIYGAYAARQGRKEAKRTRREVRRRRRRARPDERVLILDEPEQADDDE